MLLKPITSRYHLWWMVLVLAGCGFHLRSYNFTGSIESFAIAGKTRLSITEPLRQGLKQAGAVEVTDGTPSIVIELLDQRRDRRSASTAGRAQAAEYETSYAVQYRFLDGAGGELTAPTWIERQRVYRIDRGNIVGSSEEQALLERELLTDVVGQIIRAMDAVSRNLGSTADAN